jgi:hypothetical protein
MYMVSLIFFLTRVEDLISLNYFKIFFLFDQILKIQEQEKFYFLFE